ncbi:MAG: MFS transporter, partial [Rhodobacteraceae bacterium]|nr:MFS transporter [Paracoccaceae bacterium]
MQIHIRRFRSSPHFPSVYPEFIRNPVDDRGRYDRRPITPKSSFRHRIIRSRRDGRQHICIGISACPTSGWYPCRQVRRQTVPGLGVFYLHRRRVCLRLGGHRSDDYLGRAIQGLGEAPIWALGPALLSLAYPEAKGRAIGIFNASIHGGLMLGPLLGLFVTASVTSWLPFAIFAALCFGGGILVLLFLDVKQSPRRHKKPVNATREPIAVQPQRQTIIILAGIFLYGACYGIFVSVLPVSLTGTHGFGATSIAAFFVVFYAAISLAQLFAGPVSDRIGRRGFMIWGMLLTSIGIAVF